MPVKRDQTARLTVIRLTEDVVAELHDKRASKLKKGPSGFNTIGCHLHATRSMLLT